jgi:membrane-associated progesterone receptor component
MSELPTMTYEELSRHRMGPKVYVALKGKVFDVSSNEVYKEGGGYHAFAGRDASVALAKMNFAEDLMDPTKTHWSKKGEVDEKQMKILDEWVVFYEKRYKIIAILEEPNSKSTSGKKKED